MPAININGGSGGAGGGSGLEAAIAALTAAVNRNTASQGGGGPPSGAGGGKRSPLFGTAGQRADSRWLDADHNLRASHTRSEAKAEDDAFNARMAHARTLANYQEANRRAELAHARSMANYEESDNKKRVVDQRRKQRESEQPRYSAKDRALADYLQADKIRISRARTANDSKVKYAASDRALADHEQTDRVLIERKRAAEARRVASESKRAEAKVAREAKQAAKEAADPKYSASDRALADYMQRDTLLRERANRRTPAAGGGGGGGGMGRALGGAFGGLPGVGPGMRVAQFASAMGASPLAAGLAGAAAGVAVVTALMPQIVGSAMSSMEGSSAQYANFRRSTAAIGRGGNFNSFDLQDDIYMPGKVPDWMKQLGLTPEEAVAALTSTGLSPQSGAQGRELIQHVGEAEMMPFLGGLVMQRYGQSANLAATLSLNGGGGQYSNSSALRSGMMSGPTSFGMKGYFTELQKVTATAVASGMDRSAAISNVEGLLRATVMTASGGIGLGGGQGQMDWWARMTATGNASMRSGEGVTSTIAAANQAIGGIGLQGGNAIGAVATQRYINSTLGGKQPQSEADVKALIGDDVFARLSSTADGKRSIDRVIAAGKTGNASFVNEALIPIFTDNPELWHRVGVGSKMGNYSNPFLADLSTSRLFGTNLTQSGVINTTQGDGRIGPYGNVSLLRSMGDVPPEMFAALQTASNQSGVPIEVLAAIAHNESGNTWGSDKWKSLRGGSGEYGFMQLMPGTADGMGVPQDQRLDPTENAKGGARYYADMLRRTGGDHKKAAMLYNWGPGTSRGVDHFQAVMSGVGIPPSVQAYGDNFMANLERRVDPNAPGIAMRMHANVGNATMGASQQGYNTLGAAAAGSVGDAMLSFSGAVNRATEALSRFIGLLDGAGSGSGGGSGSGPRHSPSVLPNRVILPPLPSVGSPTRP